MCNRHDTMPDSVKAEVLKDAPRDGFTTMQAIAKGMITHEQGMQDIARDYDDSIFGDEVTPEHDRIARSRAKREIISHQRAFYALQGRQVSEAGMAAVADEIVNEMFG